jgi:phage shock protein E
MDIQTLKKEVESGNAILIDVREKDEWEQGHLNGALLLPMSELNPFDLPQLPRDKTLCFYCARGGRAMQAAMIFKIYYPNSVGIKYNFEDLKRCLDT